MNPIQERMLFGLFYFIPIGKTGVDGVHQKRTNLGEHSAYPIRDSRQDVSLFYILDDILNRSVSKGGRWRRNAPFENSTCIFSSCLTFLTWF